jgi:hypothetical protein
VYESGRFGGENTDVILVQKSLTKTGYMAYCIAMLKDVIKVSLALVHEWNRIPPAFI